MNRRCLRLCALAAATAAAVSGARAFTLEGPGGPRFAHVAGGPEQRAPGPAVGKPAPPPAGNYNFSGNSFNLSVTRNGRPPPPPPPAMAPPLGGAARPGMFQRFFNWW
jgi:hypothetical protein